MFVIHSHQRQPSAASAGSHSLRCPSVLPRSFQYIMCYQFSKLSYRPAWCFLVFVAAFRPVLHFPKFVDKEWNFREWSQLVTLRFPKKFKIVKLAVTPNVRLLRWTSVFNICSNALDVSCFLWWNTVGNGLGCMFLVDIFPFLSLWHRNNIICFLEDHNSPFIAIIVCRMAWYGLCYISFIWTISSLHWSLDCTIILMSDYCLTFTCCSLFLSVHGWRLNNLHFLLLGDKSRAKWLWDMGLRCTTNLYRDKVHDP